jgi:hypothetical protein
MKDAIQFSDLYDITAQANTRVTLVTANDILDCTNATHTIFIGNLTEYVKWLRNTKRIKTLERLLLLRHDADIPKVYGQLPYNADWNTIETFDIIPKPRNANNKSYRVYIGKYGSLSDEEKSAYDAYYFFGHNVCLQNANHKDVSRDIKNKKIYEYTIFDEHKLGMIQNKTFNLQSQDIKSKKNSDFVENLSHICYFVGPGLDAFIDKLTKFKKSLFVVNFVVPIEEWLLAPMFTNELLRVSSPCALFTDVGDILIDEILPIVNLRDLLISGKFLVILNYSKNRVVKNVDLVKIDYSFYVSAALKSVAEHRHARAFLVEYLTRVSIVQMSAEKMNIVAVYLRLWFIPISKLTPLLDYWYTLSHPRCVDPLHLEMKQRIWTRQTDDTVLNFFENFIADPSLSIHDKLVCCVCFLVNHPDPADYWFLNEAVRKDRQNDEFIEFLDKTFAYTQARNVLVYLLFRLQFVPFNDVIISVGVIEAKDVSWMLPKEQLVQIFDTDSNPYFLNVFNCMWDYMNGQYMPSYNYNSDLCKLIANVFAELEFFELMLSTPTWSIDKWVDFISENVEEDYDARSTIRDMISSLVQFIGTKTSGCCANNEIPSLLTLRDIRNMAPVGTEGVEVCMEDFIKNGLIPVHIEDNYTSDAYKLPDDESLVHRVEVNTLRRNLQDASKLQKPCEFKNNLPIDEKLFAVINSTTGINPHALNLKQLMIDVYNKKKFYLETYGLSVFEMLSRLELYPKEKIINLLDNLKNDASCDVSNIFYIYKFGEGLYQISKMKQIVCK